MRRVALLLVALTAAWSAPATAAPKRKVAGVALPSRRADASRLAGRAHRLAGLLAARTGAVAGAPPTTPGNPDAGSLVARGRELFLQGAVDEAAATLDVALAAAVRRPDAIGDPAALIAGQVTRVQIALARGEGDAAERLLVRLLRWDGDFAPSAAEGTPAVQSAFAAAAASQALSAPLAAADVGEVCRAVDDLLVVRAARAGAIEIARFDHCRLAASLVVRGEVADAAVIDRIAPPPARPAKAPPAGSPLHARPWLWVAVGAVAAAAIGGGIWLASEGESDSGGFDVAVRF